MTTIPAMWSAPNLSTLRREEHATMADLAAELLRQAEAKADYVVDTRRMSFTSAECESSLTFDTDDGTDGGMLKEHAHRQVADRLGIPKRYYDRMRTDAPGLLDANVTHWFREQPETRLVRMLDGRVRAFLSNRYRLLDNDDLMAHAVAPVFQQYGDRLTFHIGALTDERLYIRAILPSLSAEIRTGDVVQAGVEIRNSEVGSGALSVAPFIWRLVCLNGMLRADAGLSRYHIGREKEETLYALYRDDTLAADDAAFFLKVRDTVDAALSEMTFGQIVAQLREAATGERIEDPVAATERIAKAHDLTDGEQSSVLRYLATGGDLSQWGVANAVTAAAKHASEFDRQAELEALGGVLVALPQREFASLTR